jgi:soluble lytic murein transglycosylase-like protein
MPGPQQSPLDRLKPYEHIIQGAAEEWNLDPLLLKALVLQESRGLNGLTSTKNAQGLMQIIPGTQRELGVTDPWDPVQSIYGGAKYLSMGLDKEGTPEGALLHYHGGPGWRKSYAGDRESQTYVSGVAEYYKQLQAAANAELPVPPIPPDNPPPPEEPR